MNMTLVPKLLVVCQVFAAGTVFSQQAVESSGPLISLHTLKTDEPTPTGVRLRPRSSRETIFLVTNHTAKTFEALLSGVQVKSGSNWITQLLPYGPLEFSATNSVRPPGATNALILGLTTAELGPH